MLKSFILTLLKNYWPTPTGFELLWRREQKCVPCRQTYSQERRGRKGQGNTPEYRPSELNRLIHLPLLAWSKYFLVSSLKYSYEVTKRRWKQDLIKLVKVVFKEEACSSTTSSGLVTVVSWFLRGGTHHSEHTGEDGRQCTEGALNNTELCNEKFISVWIPVQSFSVYQGESLHVLSHVFISCLDLGNHPF